MIKLLLLTTIVSTAILVLNLSALPIEICNTGDFQTGTCKKIVYENDTDHFKALGVGIHADCLYKTSFLVCSMCFPGTNKALIPCQDACEIIMADCSKSLSIQFNSFLECRSFPVTGPCNDMGVDRTTKVQNPDGKQEIQAVLL